jgi:rod shape-determining protein MreD
MKLSLLFFAIGILLVLLQSIWLRFLPLSPIVPDLTLLLCVYWGLHHPSVGAVLGSFMLGYSVDVVSNELLGVNAFAMSLVFLMVYLSSRSVWLHNPVVSVLVVLLASVTKVAAFVLVWAIFATVESRWMGALATFLLEALVAVALAPVVFTLLRRLQSHLDTVGVPAE